MSAYRYIKGDGVVLLPLDQRWPWHTEQTPKVQDFADRVLAGDVFAPVLVVLGHDDRWSVVDGHHRLGAAVWLEHTHIPARVVENQGWSEASK
jgi:ParB-like chromosome segregation protein Spo0J